MNFFRDSFEFVKLNVFNSSQGILRITFVFFFFFLIFGLPNKTSSFASHAKLDVIVLDAGHGGKDSGAIGTNGYMEKQATLAIITKLTTSFLQ